jgi:hypothetical protein
MARRARLDPALGGSLRHQKRRAYVEVHQRVKVREGIALDRIGFYHAGVTADDGGQSPPSFNLREESIDADRVSGVGMEVGDPVAGRACLLQDECGVGGRDHIVDGNASAVFCQRGHNHTTDGATAAGDQDEFAGKIERVSHLLAFTH